jgi:uncharacterized membrane protein
MPSPSGWPINRFTLLAAVLAGIYGVMWGILDFQFYHTFSLHVWDVGANFVLTDLSAPATLGYGHLSWAPQNLIYVFFIPIARAFPDPIVLVLVQDGLLAIGGFFIYLIAAKSWNRPGLAVLLEGLYLFNYALFGAPFFPDHYEVLFSVLFPISFFLFLIQRPAMASGFLVLAALCSSLAAVQAVLFVLLFLWPELFPVLRDRLRGLGRLIRRHIYLVAAGVASIVIFCIPFLTIGYAATISYSHVAGGTSPNLIGGLETDVATKLVYFLIVLLPVIAVVRRSRYILLAVPYVGLVVFAGANNYDQLAYQYTYTIGAIIFIAVIDGLNRRYATPSPAAVSTPSPSSPSSATVSRTWRLRRAARAHPELFQITVVLLALGFIILPYSPGNALAGPYASLPFRDYQFPALVTVTPYDQALWNMASEIPQNSSVLLQENMPMLTNRAVWYEPGSYDGEYVQYALADPTVNWFVFHPPSFIGPYSVPMIQWVNDLYQNRSYGIASEYEGAILFQAGYTGAPTRFTSYSTDAYGSAFVGTNVSHQLDNGGVMSVTNANGSGPAFLEESTLVLPPGSYTLTAELLSSSLSATNHLSFGLWTKTKPAVPVEVLSLAGSNFSSSNTWIHFVLSFSLSVYVQDLQFAAYEADWPGTLALSAVYLNQTAPN